MADGTKSSDHEVSEKKKRSKVAGSEKKGDKKKRSSAASKGKSAAKSTGKKNAAKGKQSEDDLDIESEEQS